LSDAAEAQALGASGTPTFLVGSQPMVGAQPLSVFSEAIDQQRNTAGR
jgi:protein-disulfide isomerase